MTGTTDRVAASVLFRRRELVVILLVIAVVGFGAAAWTYTHPGVVENTVDRDVEVVAMSVETSATVTEPSSLWRAGTVLESNAVYPSAAPLLSLAVTTDASGASYVSGSHRVTLVYEAERDGAVFWSQHVPLDAETASGEGVSSSTVVNVTEVRQRLGAIERELGGLGTVRASIEVTGEYETERYDGTVRVSSPLVVQENGYWLDGGLDAETRHANTVTVVEERPPGIGRVGAFGATGLLALSAAVVLWRRPSPDRSTASALRYGDWISEGTLPPGVMGDTVAVSSLSGLVDVAIDANRRVIRDERTDRFVVLDGSIAYVFVPDDRDPSEKL